MTSSSVVELLEPLPPSFATTVAALHLVASELIAPAREAEGEVVLEPTPGGFGTPFFVFDQARRRVRVEGDELIQECDENERRAPLRSLISGGEAITELLPVDTRLSDEPLAVDPAASRALGTFYRFGAAVLERLVEDAPADAEPSPVRLWPEHFDLGIELGNEDRGARANYGCSPGDEQHPEPYLYVGPWTAAAEGELWNARGFPGAELPYSELLAAPDQEAAASEFFERRRDELMALAG
jgi:hypothetical protein